MFYIVGLKLIVSPYLIEFFLPKIPTITWILACTMKSLTKLLGGLVLTSVTLIFDKVSIILIPKKLSLNYLSSNF